MGTSGGGAFLPSDPPPSTGQTLTSPTLVTPTLTSPTLTSPVITGTTSVATGATLTSPAIAGTATTIAFQSAAMTATGTTGTDATAVAIGAPGLILTTGATDAGVGLGTGTAGQLYFIKNGSTTGAVKIYSVGGLINGTTGTTAYSITATGNKGAAFMCVTAGAWQVIPLAT